MAEHEYVMVVHPKDKDRVEKAVKEFAKDKNIEVKAHEYAQRNSIIFLRKDMISPLEPEEAEYFRDYFQKAFGDWKPKERNTILKPIFEKGET